MAILRASNVPDQEGPEIEPGFERAGFEHRLIEIARLVGDLHIVEFEFGAGSSTR